MKGDIRNGDAVREILKARESTRSSTSPPNRTSTDRYEAGSVHRHERARHSRAAEGGPRGWLEDRTADRNASTTSRPTRCTGPGPDRGGLHGRPLLRAELAVRGEQGGARTISCARITIRTGSPVTTTQLLQQLRTVSFPREADSADNRQHLARKALPIYGDGVQVRDWLYVSDHCRGIEHVSTRAYSGETYNLGGDPRARTSTS